MDPAKIKIHPNARQDSTLTLEIWKVIADRAAASKSGYSHDRAALSLRPKIQRLYAEYADWTSPEPRPIPEGKLRNLFETPTEPRFPLTDKVWPTKPGDASVCLWEDDKVAAISFDVDDNQAFDMPFWDKLIERHHGINITVNLVVGLISGPTKNVPMGGTWDFWKEKLKDGHYHIASHTMTHCWGPVPDDGWPGLDWECAESQRQIDSNIPGHKTTMYVPGGATIPEFGTYPAPKLPEHFAPSQEWRTYTSTEFAPPFARVTPQNVRCRASVARYYASCRLGGGQPINPANMIDYLGIHATVAVGGIMEGDPAFKPSLALSNCLNPDPKSPYHNLYRGWAYIFTHFIGQGKDWDNPNNAYEKALVYYDIHRDDFWNGFADDVALYGQERDTATLVTKEVTDARIVLDLTGKMDPAIFDYPLTVKVRLPDSWKDVKATQNGKAVPYQVILHEKTPFALAKIIPNQGQAEIIKR